MSYKVSKGINQTKIKVNYLNDPALNIANSNTEYGDVIPDDLLVKIMDDGINSSNGDVSQKWKNTRDYFDWVKNHLD